MGAPMPDMDPVDNASAEALLDSLKTIDPGERRKHASVFNYWQSIRGNRPFPPIRDLDPLEISDAGPWSVLLEMIGGGEDAVVRHFGQEIRGNLEVEKIGDAPGQSLLAAIHAKLPIVAACREALAFEESYDTGDGPSRCWVTLLPFSQTGSWIDFVYGYVSLEGAAEPEAIPEAEAVADEPEVVAEVPEIVEEQPAPEAVVEQPTDEDASEPFQVELKPYDEELAAEAEVEFQSEAMAETDDEPIEEAVEQAAFAEPEPEHEAEPEEQVKPRFSAKLLEGLASSFYGKVTQSEPTVSGGYADGEPVESWPAEPAEAVAAEPAEPAEPVSIPASNGEGVLHSKLSQVRTLAAEAREAQVRSNIALYEGLSAA